MILQIIFLVVILIILFFVLRKVFRISRYVNNCYKLKKISITRFGKENGTRFYRYIKTVPKLRKKDKL